MQMGDLYELQLSSMTWAKLSPSGTAPHARCGHTASVLPGGRYLLFHGGGRAALYVCYTIYCLVLQHPCAERTHTHTVAHRTLECFCGILLVGRLAYCLVFFAAAGAYYKDEEKGGGGLQVRQYSPHGFLCFHSL